MVIFLFRKNIISLQCSNKKVMNIDLKNSYIGNTFKNTDGEICFLYYISDSEIEYKYDLMYCNGDIFVYDQNGICKEGSKPNLSELISEITVTEIENTLIEFGYDEKYLNLLSSQRIVELYIEELYG